MLLFVVAGLRPAPDDGDTRIVVTAGRLAHLTDAFAATFQRPPTRQELEGLVDDWVREEVYAREARRLGLDRDDTVVRRRLRQKMEFLVEDAIAPADPTDAELAAYLAAHPAPFRREPTYSFQHVFLRPERRGDADTLLARLTDGDVAAAALGDPILLPPSLDGASRSEVARLFGDPFAQHLGDVPVGRWSGPLASAYGLHLVLVRERLDGRVPALAEIRDAVEREWRADRRAAASEAAWSRVRKEYDVSVEWPP